MADIQSAAAEIRRGKEEEEEEQTTAWKYIWSALLHRATINQYAYRPTGSTTAAVVHDFRSLTRMTEDSAYVRVILIDFTKAFDIADHTVLMSKLAEL